MPLIDKYKPVVVLLNELNAKDKNIREENGYLVMDATLNEQRDKQLILNKIREVNIMEADDIKTNFRFEK